MMLSPVFHLRKHYGWTDRWTAHPAGLIPCTMYAGLNIMEAAIYPRTLSRLFLTLKRRRILPCKIRAMKVPLMSIQASATIFLANRRAESRFYIVMALVAMAVAIAGFGPAAAGARKGPLTLPIGAHAAVFSGWLLLFLTQTVLIKNKRFSIHRRLGYAGAGLATLMVISGFVASVTMARRGYDLSGDLVSFPSNIRRL